ncbi:hypothetical protein sscle_03g024960 [Sclerotinia sclerotiorum 1980 UF-70]|uniref:Uncharacterized protein n=1 Tax=Sclerotinia sclerotiorum (strain ATCC 18683 / 1980 / Ss-1) TaxID=665079 RepID=A0A1D9PYJ6_SCLS1|nr:hypothetical protein sscle_03g024960 [Sclerotinia sclerotiorum 1980 UF-70]
MNIDNLPRLPAASKSTSTSASSNSSPRTSPSNAPIKNKHKNNSSLGNFSSSSIPASHPPVTTPWEENKLYIHLTDRGNPGTFHWSLYLTEEDPEKGWVYHVYDPEPGRWILEMLGPAGPVVSGVVGGGDGDGEDEGEGEGGGLGFYAGGDEGDGYGDGDGGLDVEDREIDSREEGKEDEDSNELNVEGTKDREVVEAQFRRDRSISPGIGNQKIGSPESDKEKTRELHEKKGEEELEGAENRESEGVGTSASKRNFTEEEEKNLSTGKRLKVQEARNEDQKAEINPKNEETPAISATTDEKDDNYTNLTHTTLLAAVEIGTNIQDMREIIEQTICSIWVYEKRRIGRGDKTCRQFLMHCISEMESLGILSLLPGKSGFDLEREAKEFGMLSDPALNPGARRGRLWKSRIIS